MDSYKFIELSNVCILNENDGIGVHKRILKLFCGLAIITNLYLTFFVFEENVAYFKHHNKLYFIIVLQNVALLAIFFAKSFEGHPNCKYLSNLSYVGLKYNQKITRDLQEKLICYKRSHNNKWLGSILNASMSKSRTSSFLKGS